MACDFYADGVVFDCKSVKYGAGTEGSEFWELLYVVDFGEFVKYKFVDLLIGSGFERF